MCRRNTSVFTKILIPLMCVMMIQALLSFGAIMVGGTTRIINENYVSLLRQNVENRKNNLESAMNQNWSVLDNLQKAADETLSRVMEKHGADIFAFSGDCELQEKFLTEISSEMLIAMRKNNTMGVFLILNNSVEMPDPAVDQEFEGICFRDLDPTMNPGNYSDVLLERGASNIASSAGLAMDSWWKSSYQSGGAGDTQNMDYLFKPLKAAYDYPGAGSKNLGYWSAPYYLNGEQDASQVISYSMPLLSEDGVPYGVMGVEISISQLNGMLPSGEVDGANRGGYLLVGYDEREPAVEREYSALMIAGNMLRTMLQEGERFTAVKDGSYPLYELPELKLYGENVFGVIAPMNLYNSNTPFANEKWAVMGVANHDALFEISDQLEKNTLIAVFVSLLIGFLSVYIVSNVISQPILKLVDKLKSTDSNAPISLQSVGVWEIDELAGTINDLSHKQKEGEWALQQERERYLMALESSTDIIYEYDRNRDTFTVYHFSGEGGKGEIVTNVYRDMTLLVRSGAVCHPDDIQMMLSFFNGGVEEQVVFRIHSRDMEEGRDYIWCLTKGKAVYDSNRSLLRIVGSTKNITEEKEAERLKIEQNRRDKVTKLYNMSSGLGIAGQYLKALPEGERAFVCVLDMDRFQNINNQYGLLYSDILLEQAGEAVLGQIKEKDVGVRLGGDEFLLLLTERTAEEAEDCINRIRGEVSRIYVGELSEKSLNFSAGIAEVSGRGELAGPMREALAALFSAKQSGRGGNCFFGKDTLQYMGKRQVNRVDSVFYEDHDNLVSFVFNLFEKTSDIKSVINTLLGKLGRQFRLNRIIVIDSDADFCTIGVAYQWHRRELEPYTMEVDHYSDEDYKKLFSAYEDRDSMLLQEVPESGVEKCIRDAYGRLEEKNGLCSVMYDDAKPIGAVFFLTGREDMEWTEKIRVDLQEIVKIMGAYISKSKSDTASRAKGDFLSRMSHEIRTPMNAIIGMTTIARSVEELPEKAADCLAKIDSSTKYLLSLINDILDMSRIESGKLTLEKIDFNINDVIREIDLLIRPQADEKGLYFEIQEQVHTKWLNGDSMKLNQVLINILGNALKFTEKGGSILFAARELEEEGDAASIRFSVKDTGIGISEEHRDRIFKAFEQAGESTVREYGGTGLGLAISSNLVKMQGGRLDFVSEVGKGTEFFFTLTFQKGSEYRREEETEENGRPDMGDFRGKRLLLVEDNELNVEIARELLMMAGFEIEVAFNGKEAVESFKEKPAFYYDAVLMDIRMPVMDGLEATKIIRTLEKADSRSVPIIAMTANAFDEDMKKSIESGMNGHMSKPIDIDRLCGILREVLNSPDQRAAREKNRQKDRKSRE